MTPRAKVQERCARCGYLPQTRIHDLSSTHPGKHRYQHPATRQELAVWVVLFFLAAGCAIAIGAALALAQ